MAPPRPVRILMLAVNLITAACGGGGPAAPSVEPETRAFSGAGGRVRELVAGRCYR